MGKHSGVKMFAAVIVCGLVMVSCGKKATTSSSATTVKIKTATTKAGTTATTAKASTATTKKGSTATTAKASTATTKKGSTATTAAASTPTATGKGRVKPSLPTVPAPATTLKKGSGPLGTLKPANTVRPASTLPPVTVAAGNAPAKPEDRNCGDFATWDEAKQFFDTYYPYYGDVARLDGDGDGIPCESLPGSPK